MKTLTNNHVLQTVQTDYGLVYLLFFQILLIPNLTTGLIGYDCGSTSANITTISLLEVGECDIPDHEINTTKTYIQLIQINEFNTVRVYQCKIEIDRVVQKCGMFSHTSIVLNGRYAYIEEVSRETCQQLHLHGSINIQGSILTGIRRNQTISRPVTLGGRIDNDGICAGTAYSDPYGSWTNVIVTGTVKITLRDYIARVRIDTNKVHLQSGVICELGNGHCVDIEGGNTFWTPIPEENCKMQKYGVLYEGKVDKSIDKYNEYPQTVYSLTTEDITFALTSKSKIMVCGHTLIRTEHPKLLIFEVGPGEFFVNYNKVHVANLDIFAYVNSKFIYVEKHIRTQIKQLYRNTLMQRCNLEQRMLKNALSIASEAPDEFAYHLMKGPGYMTVIAGEVIHIIKCIPIEVKLRETQECYHQLPVQKGNNTYYLTPRTHVLLTKGIQITCSILVPPMYLLEGSWYKMSPKPVEAIAPTVIKPLTAPTWKYISPKSLATSGIYSENDLTQLRDHIMFPAEKPAVINTIVRGLTGKSIVHQGISLTNMLDESSLEKIAASAWEKTWGKFLKFGNISAGVIGLIMILRLIKLLVDTVIHGYTIHSIYGWSIHLVGAIWDSVTHLLVHLNHRTEGMVPKNTEEKENSKDIKEKENNSEGPSLESPTNEVYPSLSDKTSEITKETIKQEHFFTIKP